MNGSHSQSQEFYERFSVHKVCKETESVWLIDHFATSKFWKIYRLVWLAPHFAFPFLRSICPIFFYSWMSHIYWSCYGTICRQEWSQCQYISRMYTLSFVPQSKIYLRTSIGLTLMQRVLDELGRRIHVTLCVWTCLKGIL